MYPPVRQLDTPRLRLARSAGAPRPPARAASPPRRPRLRPAVRLLVVLACFLAGVGTGAAGAAASSSSSQASASPPGGALTPVEVVDHAPSAWHVHR